MKNKSEDKNKKEHIFRKWVGFAKKKIFNNRTIIGFLFCFLSLSIVGELVIFFLLPNELTDQIPFLVVPAVALCITIIIIHNYRHNNKQLDTLTDAFERVSCGDYNVSLDVPRRGGYKVIYRNFNKMAKELSSVQILKDGFIQDFSHEFKTPIASINGFANLLLEGDLTEEERVQYLKIIADESSRLSTLAESTLMLSRLENQQFVGEIKPYRLDLQVKECIILLEHEWASKNISIVSDIDEVEFNGNAQLMQQVWVNLLGNAVKFTPQGGEITISLKNKNGGITALISDNGIGMSEEVALHVFDKYFQGDSSRFTPGNGLGLAIVKRIVTLSGGTISVESRDGEGSTFIVEFAKEIQD